MVYMVGINAVVVHCDNFWGYGLFVQVASVIVTNYVDKNFSVTITVHKCKVHAKIRCCPDRTPVWYATLSVVCGFVCDWK